MILINSIAIAFIATIVWWFWIYTPKQQAVQLGVIDIEVNNGVYTPAAIKINAGESVTLRFNRLDPSPCAQTVLIPKIALSKSLALNDITTIELNDLAQGEYAFHCQMQMYRGVIVVE